MEKALYIQKEVQKILDTEDVYLVGGSVRDLVMGNTPKSSASDRRKINGTSRKIK